MSREEYQIPTAMSPVLGGGSSGAPIAGQYGADGSLVAAGDNDIKYSCGDCGHKLSLKRSEPIRCIECGCRVLYKNRTNRMIEFEAR